jgi:hypothetical protein
LHRISILLLFLSISLLPPTTASAVDITLKWDAVYQSGVEVAGYKMYYKSGSGGPPYDGTGGNGGSSPIDIPIASLANPDLPELLITGLADEVWYFVCTAYDVGGNESEFSNEVCTLDTGNPPGATLYIKSKIPLGN